MTLLVKEISHFQTYCTHFTKKCVESLYVMLYNIFSLPEPFFMESFEDFGLKLGTVYTVVLMST